MIDWRPCCCLPLRLGPIGPGDRATVGPLDESGQVMAVPLEEERGSGRHSRPDATNSTVAIVPTWAEVFEDAERWVTWNGRRRWPNVALNDQVWAVSIADWATYGRRAA